ncbi:hypothetical protein [Tateyamaria sp. ANG-S1]|uniref:hypothetical protein n=1 Tax=Tateyamaria sp. ANG-S1 TaxID=1577905 RepID=UPI00057EC30B|nr:hypothetical protein [Tateyamaria sp. ANG-S1]KIC49646.1 hypothetical protein RA29_08215 [Tateyamaria sp. ANG-S1]
MEHEPIQVVIDQLDDLLDAERTALLDGDLDRVERLFERKTSLIACLSRMSEADAQDVQAVRLKVERNQDLLQSAADGIKSVARRLAAVRRVRESLETYDARGKRTTVDVKTASVLEKRA